MANTDLAVRIATTLDSTGIKKADTAIGKFEKNVKSLGKTLGIALSGAAITAYGKAAVKAFAADEAAVQRLATAVDNLGLSYFKTDIEDFIAKTEQSAGILDDKLRPAFQALLTTTGSLTKSQKLLNDAITISRASGVDLATVSQDLANGYVGITRGLRKYNTGLTQTELKTKSFAEILGVLLTKSAGAAETYLGTTAYQMDVLTVASENAKETIGKGLVDAFALLGGGSTTTDAAKNIDKIAKAIAGVATAMGAVAGFGVNVFRGLDYLTSLGGLLGTNGRLFNGGNQGTGTYPVKGNNAVTGYQMTPEQKAAAAAAKAAEAAAAARAKELAAFLKKQAALQKAVTAEQKKQNSLKKSAGIFDMEQIQIIAAMKGKLTEDEKLRLQLQLAILQGNDKVAADLATKLAESQYKTENLAVLLAGLPKAINPFADWITNLDEVEARLRRIAMYPAPTAPTGNVPSTPFPDPSASQPEIDRERGRFYGSSNVGGTVVVQIDGRAIANAVLDQSMSAGQVAYLDRRTGGFG